MITVERLRGLPADTLAALVADSEAQGVRFVRRLVDEWNAGVNRFDGPGEALFVARRAGAIVGICGLNIDPYANADGRPRIGRLRHLYVLSTHRRLGIGGRIVVEVIAAARGTFDRVRLHTSNPAAAALYEHLGFRPGGGDPRCTHIIAVDGTPDMSNVAERPEVRRASGGEVAPPRRPRWIAIAVGGVVLAGSYSQWILFPGVTPFLGPGLALAGAGVITWLFIDTLATSLRRHRARKRLPLRALAVNAVLVVLLVVLPLTRLPAALRGAEGGAPRVLSGFRDWLGAEGYPRIDGLHRGIDIAGRVGDAVLASADGRVVVAADSGGSCGSMVVIVHDDDGHRTMYCHLSAISVRVGDDVRRGVTIGAVGTSGMRPWPGYEHVHWTLQKGRHGPWLDPIARTVGCFDAAGAYPTDRLALTYPVRC